MGYKHVIGLTDSENYTAGKKQSKSIRVGEYVGVWDIKGIPIKLAPVITNNVTQTFRDIDASADVSFAITTDNKMYAWGDNDLGTLAVGDYSDKNIPTLVKGQINWKSTLEDLDFKLL